MIVCHHHLCHSWEPHKKWNQCFCPSLMVMAQTLDLSENVAGVTILAFGNGAPDIFTSLTGTSTGNEAMAFSELLGGGIFISTVLTGCMCFLFPFKIMAFPYLRDCTFYIIGLCWSFYVFNKGEVHLWEAAGFVGLYFIYLGCVIMRKKVKKKVVIRSRTGYSFSPEQIEHLRKLYAAKTSNPTSVDDEDEDENAENVGVRPLSNEPRDESIAARREGQRRNALGRTISELVLQAERLYMLNEAGNRNEVLSELKGFRGDLGSDPVTGDQVRPQGLFKEFFYEMNPLDIEQWKGESCCVKCLSLIQIPAYFLLKLVIPVVNYTVLNNGWCKLLNTMHCFTMPLYTVFITKVALLTVMPGIHIMFLVVLFGISFALMVFFTSEQICPPVYHIMFSFLGFISSVVTVYLLANEVVGLVKALGLLFGIHEAALGATIVAWGNCVGDMVTILSIARAGFQRMAFAACVGGPMFNTLLGLGISLIIATSKENDFIYKVHFGEQGPVVALFLLMSLVSSLFAFTLMSFHARRSYGCHLLVLYGMFLIYVILCETDFCHPLGSDHKT